MKIDISRMNLLEKDIEDWLYENPRAIGESYPNETYIAQWIGRQYHLPSGIADLVGVRHNGKLVVIEVKNVPINKAAVLQVCRYAADLSDIVGNRDGYYRKDSNDPFDVQKILVGPSIDGQTFQEASACGVRVMQFSAELKLTVGQLSVTMNSYSERQQRINEISLRDEWKVFGSHYSEYTPRQSKEADNAEEERYREAYLASAPQREEQEEKDMYDKLMEEAALRQNDPEEDEF